MKMDASQIKTKLREKICWLDLKPDAVLNISELAEELEVSRTPIKESLIFLQAEGWVLRNTKGFVVTPLSLQLIREMTEIRSSMEVQSNVWAMQRMTDDELKILDYISHKISRFDLKHGKKEMARLDLSLHITLFKATKNDQLAQILERNLMHITRFWLSVPIDINPDHFFIGADEIIQAVKSKDEERLRTVSIDHIKGSATDIISFP